MKLCVYVCVWFFWVTLTWSRWNPEGKPMLLLHLTWSSSASKAIKLNVRGQFCGTLQEIWELVWAIVQQLLMWLSFTYNILARVISNKSHVMKDNEYKKDKVIPDKWYDGCDWRTVCFIRVRSKSKIYQDWKVPIWQRVSQRHPTAAWCTIKRSDVMITKQ